MAGIFAQTVRFRSLAMARGAVLTGRTFADLVQTALTLLVLAAFGLLLLLGYAFTWIGALIGLFVRTPRRPPPAG